MGVSYRLKCKRNQVSGHVAYLKLDFLAYQNHLLRGDAVNRTSVTAPNPYPISFNIRF